MTSSHKKFAIVLLFAIVVSIALIGTGHDLLGSSIGLAMIFFGINRHVSKCRHCQSWWTYARYIEAAEGGPGTIRICRKCGQVDVIDESVLMVETWDDE